MKKNRASRLQKTGMGPGTLLHVGEKKVEQSIITLIDYSETQLQETCFTSITESHNHHRENNVLWLNVYGLHEPHVMSEIGRRFHLHPLVLEDILNTDQRPKVDDYGDYLYIVARFFEYDTAASTVSSDQISIVLGKNFVLTFQERPSGSFDPIRDRLRNDKGQIRKLGADYLAYELLDSLVDRYFVVLEELTDRTEQLEDDLLLKATPLLLKNIHQFKRETLKLRRAVWPLREVLNTLTRSDPRFFQPATQPYLHDLYDHTVHVIESLEAIRDLLAGMLDIYLSSISNRLNAEVRILTMFTAMFMPASLIAGIFGMNFRNQPLLENPIGFYIAIGMMAGIALIMATVFWIRRRRS